MTYSTKSIGQSNEPKFIAFLDILGFKDLIENNDIETLEKLYDKFEPSLFYSMALANIRHKVDSNSFNEYKLPGIGELELNSLVISDSIIIWTDDTHPNSLVELISFVKCHMFLSIEIGLPLRGAIAMGNLSIKSGKHEYSNKYNSYTTILGKPLTRAYLLENKLNCIGCIIDDECIERFDTLPGKTKENGTTLTIKSLEEFNFIKKYCIPMKGSKVEEKYVINWTNHLNGRKLDADKIRSAFSMHNKKIDTWEVEEKILNSLKFFNDCEEDYKKLESILKK